MKNRKHLRCVNGSFWKHNKWRDKFVMMHFKLSNRIWNSKTIIFKESPLCYKQISAFIFAKLIVQFLYFLSRKFPASSHLLYLYRS